MNKDSGFGVLYLLILFFIIMIFIPPVFRMLIPKTEKETNSLLQTLECKKIEALTGDLDSVSINYEIKTLYSGEKISVINFKYSIITSPTIAFSDVDQTKITNLTFNDIISLKDIQKANIKEEGNVTTLTFNYLSNDFKNEAKLQKYSQNINNQKSMYEKESFSCTIN